MNIMDLKQAIYNLPDEMEVRLAQQPAWAFEYSVGDVIATKPGDEYYIMRVGVPDGAPWADGAGWYVTVDGEELPEPVAGPYSDEISCEAWIADKIKDQEPILYITEGTQLGYLPGEARRAISW
jgi:hypothetical protein